MSERKDPQQDDSVFLAYNIVGLYALFGGLWILLSDRLLWALVADKRLNQAMQTYKGWFYVAVTAVFLYLLIRRALARMKRLEEARHSAELKFLQAQKMELVGRLASGVAHDFNNVLTAIMGLTQMTVETMPKDDPRREDLYDILKFSERATSITGQLLAFSRKQFSQPQPLDLAGQVRGAEKMLRRAAGETVEIEFKLGRGLWKVLADPCQFDQVLLNLAVNARDSMPQGGKFTVSADKVELKADASAGIQPGEYVELTARDNGCGMDRATLDQAFEPFFTTKDPGKGTGLGLSVVKGIIEQAGGHVAAESRVGEGTLFRVYLPKYNGPMPAAGGISAGELPAGGKETVLLVDDQPDLLRVIGRVLEGHGYTVLCAATYEEALKHAAAGCTDLLVTDVILGVRNGPDLADEVRKLCPGVRTLFISGYAADPVVQGRVLNRNLAFLLKPFTTAALLAKVRRTLDAAG